MQQMELATPVGGMNAMDYMVTVIERNDNDQITIEKGKLTISVFQQMNNRSRIILDAYKYQLKKNELEGAPKQEVKEG